MLRIMHNASHNASAFCINRSFIFDAMSDASNRLKEARLKRGYESAKAAAEAMGVSVATYIQHENGTRGVPANRAEQYGKFFRVAPEWILYGNRPVLESVPLGPQLQVKGTVAAGIWLEASEMLLDECETFTGRGDIKSPASERYGLRVQGDSMNEIYPSGTILECIKFNGDYLIANGRRVIVERRRFDGTVEATVKEYFKDDKGVEWLVPRSRNPAFQAPFRCDQPEPEIERIEITGIVVAAIIPE
jgi:SOS-response transcriptional repressor LexA